MADKFKDTIITDTGRKLLMKIGGGEGTLTYTKAVLSSQDFTGKEDEEIRAVTGLSDDLMETTVGVTTITDNTITVVASFSNRDLTADVNYNSVGWFAKSSTDNKEILLGITPTNGPQVVASGSPDHRSTESMEVDLNMAISNDAKVDMTVNEAGIVHQSDLTYEITKAKDWFTQELHDYAYSKGEVDEKIASAGTTGGKGGAIVDINGVKPDKDGHLDLGSSTLIQGIQTRLTNILSRLDYIEKNYLEGRRFNVADDDAAMKWENEKITRIAMMVDDSATPPSSGTSTGTQTSGTSGTNTNK